MMRKALVILYAVLGSCAPIQAQQFLASPGNGVTQWQTASNSTASTLSDYYPEAPRHDVLSLPRIDAETYHVDDGPDGPIVNIHDLPHGLVITTPYEPTKMIAIPAFVPKQPKKHFSFKKLCAKIAKPFTIRI